MAIRQNGGMWTKGLALFIGVLITVQLLRIGAISYQWGANTACATAKECPPDFKAKWVEAGCLCVPSSKARR